MRVLLVHQPADGGVARHVADLRAGLPAGGHEVVTCGPQRIAGAAGAAHVELALGRAISPGADAAAAAALRAAVRRLSPDVVHAHSSKAGAVARLACAGLPVPVLYTPHGYAFAGHFERPAERQAYLWVERALAPLGAGVLCVCDAEARLARVASSRQRTWVVPNGVSAPPDGPIDPRVQALAALGPVVATVTLLRPGKGAETLIAAFAQLRRRLPAAQLAIAGDGPERSRLGALAHGLGVGGAVHFLGSVADPLAVLRGARAFALASWAESLPYALLEAMSLGLPCVASAVGGIPEAVRQGRDGLLVAPRDPATLARALGAVLEDPDLGAALGDSARARTRELFTVPAMVAGIERAYRAACVRPAPGAQRPRALAAASGD